MDSKKFLAQDYESLLSKDDKLKIEKFVRNTPKTDFDEVYSFPRMVFLNGYYYAKSITENIKELDEYMEKPFVKMAKTKVNIEGKRLSELERFIWRPEPNEIIVRDCFIAGMKAYENEIVGLAAV
jgi:hypothetical protein